MKKDLTKLINDVKKIVERHKLETGSYSRWSVDNGTDRKMEINEYGCSDAANILYTIGDFPREVSERQSWIQALQNMQNPDTGLFQETTHHPMHTTAHCLAALELFDAAPLYKLSAFAPYMTREGLYQFFEELEWVLHPWQAAHRGAGLYAALNLAGEATREWNSWYFSWLWDEADPETGLWRKGHVKNVYYCMGGSFHYLFNHEHAKMPLRYPDKMIDTCLDLYYNKAMGENFGKQLGFVECDWVYCISRSLRQCSHRFEECVETITDFAGKYLDFLMSLDPDASKGMDDLHSLFGAMCCVAELQQFLPGCILTSKPLKLVLDRRPFI